MKHWNKFICIVSLATSFCCIGSLFGGVAFGASTPPIVTVLPVFKEGAVTPTRLAEDGLGNIYVTDPHAEGINVYNGVGKLVNKFVTAVEPGGIAFAKNGDLLVTQGTYVVALDPATGAEKRRFGSFLSAFYITVDRTDSTNPVRAASGKIFVSDIKDYVVQVFDNAYADVDVSAGTAHNAQDIPGNAKWYRDYRANFIGDNQNIWGVKNTTFNRPAGVAIEKNSGNLVVVDSLSGKLKFFDQAGNYLATIGSQGYDVNHQFIRFTYPQSVDFEYTATGVLDRAYILDTFQSYVMVLDATTAAPAWTWLEDISLYGHDNGDLIAPSDLLVDSVNPNNSHLFVSNGFGSLTVFGLANLQPFNVTIDNVQNTTLRVNWLNSASASITGIRIYRSTTAGALGTNVSGILPSTAVSYTDTALLQYTTYYYTVRAVYGSNTETTNISQVSAKTTGLFNLSINLNGNGSVNGSAACPSGTCVSSQNSDALITLTATASGQSVFEGWTGDCFTTAETCIVTMDSAKLVTAFFSAKLAFRVDGVYFDNLQSAYNAASDGSVIKVLAGTWPSTNSTTEYNTAWQAKSVTIEGGYDGTFTSNSGASSVVVGRTNLNSGKVVMKQFKVK